MRYRGMDESHPHKNESSFNFKYMGRVRHLSHNKYLSNSDAFE